MFKVISPLVLLVFGLVSPLAAQTETKPEGSATITFKKVDHDFGDIDNVGEVSTSFPFTNTGNAPLVIENVSTSCGCTSSKPEKTSFAAGESGEIPVTFNPSRFSGAITKQITIYTNDTQNPRATLTIKAQVVTDVVSKPTTVFFAEARVGQMSHQEIFVSTTRLDRLEISNLKTSDEFIGATLNRLDDKNIQILVTLDGTKFPEGHTRPRGFITYDTNSKSMGPMRTNITINILRPLKVSPNFVLFWASKQGTNREMNLAIESTQGQEFQLGEIKSDLKFVTVTIEKDEVLTKSLMVKLTDSAPEGQFKGQVTIKTNIPEQKEIVIPIRGSVIP